MLQTRSRVPAIVLRGPEATPLMLPMASCSRRDGRLPVLRTQPHDRAGRRIFPADPVRQADDRRRRSGCSTRGSRSRATAATSTRWLWSSLARFTSALSVEYDNLIRPSAWAARKAGDGLGTLPDRRRLGESLIGAGSASGWLAVRRFRRARRCSAAVAAARGELRLIMSEFAAADASAESSVEPPPSAPGAESAASARRGSGSRRRRRGSARAGGDGDRRGGEGISRPTASREVSDRGADGKGVFPLLCAVLANDAPLVRALLMAPTPIRVRGEATRRPLLRPPPRHHRRPPRPAE